MFLRRQPRRGCRRPRRPGPVHQRHHRAAEGRRHHQRAAERADPGIAATVPRGRAAHGGNDVRPVLPRRRLAGHARQPVLGQHLGRARAIRRRRVVAPGAGASGTHRVHGADDAATDPRPSRLRQHRPELAGRHRLRRGRRARRVGAPRDGRAAACGVCQRVRPDRDPRRLHDVVAGRSPRSRPRGIGRPAAARS